MVRQAHHKLYNVYATVELLVGYGLRNNATATVKDSFQDMVSKQRYSVVWVIGAPQRSSASICLSATQMTLGGTLDAAFATSEAQR